MTSDCRTFGALLARLRQNRLDSAGWLLRLRGGRVPSENVVKWYGGVVQVAPASEVKYISFSVFAAAPALVAEFISRTLRRHTAVRRDVAASLLLRQQRRCGVTFAHCCCGSRDVAASHSQTAVAAAETLRRHTLTLLLRQQRRCGVTLSDCCCGSSPRHRHCSVRKRQLLRLLPRGALWPNVALKKPNETMLRPRSKSPQLWPGLIGL